ncbi:MAG: phosphatidate cytidylyltransferase [Rhodocyclaceae bacterium]
MLGARVATALVLLAGFLYAVFGLPAPGWHVLVAVLAAIAAWEWSGLSGGGSASRFAYVIATGAAALWSASTAERGGAGTVLLIAIYALAIAFWLTVAPLWLRKKWSLRGGVLAALVGWLVLLPPACALVQLRATGPWLLIAAMALAWVSDTAAYFVGRACGRRKLAPSISPGKTWEGVGGALAAVLIAGAIALALIPAQAIPAGLAPWLLLGLVPVTAVGIVGDLFESLLKRQAGVKDSSHLLPGHGGLLDRIDSLTATLPCIGLASILLLK